METMTNKKISLTESEIAEMKRVKSYFPYRVVSGVKSHDGSFEIFANSTAAKANKFAKKNGFALFRLG